MCVALWRFFRQPITLFKQAKCFDLEFQKLIDGGAKELVCITCFCRRNRKKEAFCGQKNRRTKAGFDPLSTKTIGSLVLITRREGDILRC